MANTSQIGAALVEARRNLGLSQCELGERVGVKQQQIARWEHTDYRSASLERVAAAAQALYLDLGGAFSGVHVAAEDPADYGAGTVPEVAAALRRVGVPHSALAAFARSHGIDRLEFFGSVLTPEFGRGSDVDVLATYQRGSRPSLMQAADHETELSAMMRRRVDLVSRPAVESGRNRIRRDAILGSAKTVYVAR